jgi:transposase
VLVAPGGLIPDRVSAQLMGHLFGVSPSASAIGEWRHQVAGALDGFDAQCVEMLRRSPVLGADETGLRVDTPGSSYAHVGVTDEITRFHLGDRSTKGVLSGGVLGDYPGVLVTDGYSLYWSIVKGGHQACLAHLQRELRFFRQNLTPKLSAACGLDEVSASLSAAISGSVTQGDLTTRLSEIFARALGHLSELTELGATAGLEKNLTNLLTRMSKLLVAGELLAFMGSSMVPPTNNWSERALRPLKVKQKRSGTFRSDDGARDHLRIAGYLDTARKQGHDPLEALRLAIGGAPIMPRALALTG